MSIANFKNCPLLSQVGRFCHGNLWYNAGVGVYPSPDSFPLSHSPLFFPPPPQQGIYIIPGRTAADQEQQSGAKQTDRQTDKQKKERQKDRQKDRKTERQKEIYKTRVFVRYKKTTVYLYSKYIIYM